MSKEIIYSKKDTATLKIEIFELKKIQYLKWKTQLAGAID